MNLPAASSGALNPRLRSKTMQLWSWSPVLHNVRCSNGYLFPLWRVPVNATMGNCFRQCLFFQRGFCLACKIRASQPRYAGWRVLQPESALINRKDAQNVRTMRGPFCLSQRTVFLRPVLFSGRHISHNLENGTAIKGVFPMGRQSFPV